MTYGVKLLHGRKTHLTTFTANRQTELTEQAYYVPRVYQDHRELSCDSFSILYEKWRVNLSQATPPVLAVTY